MSDDESTLTETARQLGEKLASLASRLRPFPAFVGMATIQAVELEPPDGVQQDYGCVVVTPEGEIRQLDLAMIAGPAGVGDVEHVEEFRELDLPLGDYVAYARLGVELLTAELELRGQKT